MSERVGPGQDERAAAGDPPPERAWPDWPAVTEDDLEAAFEVEHYRFEPAELADHPESPESPA